VGIESAKSLECKSVDGLHLRAVSKQPGCVSVGVSYAGLLCPISIRHELRLRIPSNDAPPIAVASAIDNLPDNKSASSVVWQGYYLTNFEQSQLRVVGEGARYSGGWYLYLSQPNTFMVCNSRFQQSYCDVETLPITSAPQKIEQMRGGSPSVGA